MLAGPTLHLRPLREADRAATREAIRDPAIWAQHPDTARATPAGHARWFAEALAPGGALAIEAREDGRLVGSSRFQIVRCGAGEVETGRTFLARRFWGGGSGAAGRTGR